jgi:hypothetical protein
MGVTLENENCTSFDLLREIETARMNLFNKQQKNNSNVQIMEINNEAANADNLQLEWLQEETSEPDEFTIVLSRKKRREAKKALRISPINTKGKKAQEDPSLPKRRGRKKG